MKTGTPPRVDRSLDYSKMNEEKEMQTDKFSYSDLTSFDSSRSCHMTYTSLGA
jgi:tRNA U34 5-carboxymethylaminomethyl modifying enzyme MnmG/GidA